MSLLQTSIFSQIIFKLHDGGRQYGASSEYGVIFRRNLNLGIIRVLDRDEALLRNF